MPNLYNRTIITEIEKYLETNDIIVLHGARQVGKTSIIYYLIDLLTKQQKITFYIDLEDSRYLNILNQGVDEFIKHLREQGILKNLAEKAYIFIDEIQYLENPSSFLKLVADHHRYLKLIVSGSSSFAIKNKFKDSLVGRTVNFEIFNLSFQEFLTFKNSVLVPQPDYTDLKIAELINLFTEFVLYGGYPKVVLTDEVEKKEKYLQQIIDTYLKKDIRDLANIKNIELFNKLLEAIAAQGGQQLNINELANTTRISKPTIDKYLFILENTYIIKLVRPFHTNIRSELFKLPKLFFYDTGLLQMLWLKKIPQQLLGNVFETSIFTELAKLYGKDNVFYWRTKDKKEIDFILEKDNKLLPIETKLNFASSNLTAINYFLKHYHLQFYNIVALLGSPNTSQQIHPWDLVKLF